MPLINVFLITSTYLIAFAAIIRYVAVVIPFRSRNNRCIKHIGIVSLLIFCFVTLVTSPQFLFYEIVSFNMTINNTNSLVLYSLGTRLNQQNTLLFAGYINQVFPVLSSFLPCLVLIAFNVGLIYRLQRAKMARRYVCNGQQITSTSAANRGCSRRLTITLILMFTAHIVLVAPSEVIKYFAFYDWADQLGDIIACVLNLTQACNFALNFVLFISTNSSFRSTFCQMIFRLFGCKKKRRNSYITVRQFDEEFIELKFLGRKTDSNNLFYEGDNIHGTDFI